MEKIIYTLREDKVPLAINILKEKNLLVSEKCIVCKKQISKENIGGFVPHGDKVAMICDNPHCYLESIRKVRETNGNGSV